MSTLRWWIIVAWIALPTVMYGGYSLLRLINRGNVLTSFQVGWFRAGHAHAGLLILMSILYYSFLDPTSLSLGVKYAASGTLVAGILAQSGGFFIHMMVGKPDQPSIGTTVTAVGAALLVVAVAVLVYGLIATG